MSFQKGQQVLIKNPGDNIVGTIAKNRPGNIGQSEDKMIYEVLLGKRYYRSTDLEAIEEKPNGRPKKHGPEWIAAFTRMVESGQRFLANQNDRAAWDQFVEAGERLGLIVPIEE